MSLKKKLKSANAFNKTIYFTKSSFAVSDCYNPNGVFLYKLRNMYNNFFLLRSLEQEFTDFKIYNLNYYFKETIYNELYKAYRRGDNVGLIRHCSEGIYIVSF